MGKPEQYGKYLKRCLDKTEEIRNMSDRMFEYTLVFEGAEEVEKQELSLSVLWKEFEDGAKLSLIHIFLSSCLQENRQDRKALCLHTLLQGTFPFHLMRERMWKQF